MRECIRIRLEDGTVGLVHVDRRPPAKCSVCRLQAHTRECDGPAPHRSTGTCDAKLCDECATTLPRLEGGEDIDLCPRCSGAVPEAPLAAEGRRRGLFHVELLQPWPWALTLGGAPCAFPRARGWDGKVRSVPAPERLAGSWLALWAPSGYDDAAAQWMRSALGLHVPGPEALPQGAYVALAELSGSTSVCNDGRSFNEPWWGGTGRTWGTHAWWLAACSVEPLAPPQAGLATAKSHLQPLDAHVVAELRRRYEATVSGRWWPPRYEPARHRAPMHDDSPVPPMLEHPEQGQLL